MKFSFRGAHRAAFTFVPRGGFALLGALAGLAALGSVGGCARQPPSSSTLSGKRLRVTMRFRDAIDPNNHYFFLINYIRDGPQGDAGDSSAPGPIPVFGPISANQGFGNGFATSSDHGANSTPARGTGGFTDFVEYYAGQYRLFHVLGDPVNRNFRDEGQPVFVVRPGQDDAQSYNRLQFEIDLSQLILDAAGNPPPASDQTQTLDIARNRLRYLQVNIIATDVIPADQGTQITKEVDALGDTSSLLGQSNFLRLDVSQTGVIPDSPSDPRAQNSLEPTGNDVVVYSGGAFQLGGKGALDLTDWTIEVRQQ